MVREDQGEILLPKLSYQLLCVLCDAAPAIVSQDTLMKCVWPNIIVSDETLKQRVKLLRKSLNDSASSPIYIEVVRGRGYRILPEVVAQIIDVENHLDKRQILPKDNRPVKRLNKDDEQLSATASVLAYWRMMLLVLSMSLLPLVGLFVWYIVERNDNADIQAFVEPLKPAPAVKKKEVRFSDQLYQKALIYYHRYREEDNRHAIDLFHSAIELDEDLAPAYAGLSDAYSQGVFQFNGPVQWQKKAVEAAYKAIALDPDLAAGYKALGLAYYNKGWLAKAVMANLKALRKEGNFNEAMSNLGFIYREMGLLAQAFHWTGKALEIEPNNSVSMVHQALNFMALSQFVESKRWLDKSLLLQPDSVFANDALGLWYLQQGQFEAAKMHYLKQLSLLPQQWQFRLGLAQSYVYLNQFSAIQGVIKPLNIPENTQIQDKVQLLVLLAENQQEVGHNQALIARIKHRLERGSDRAEDSFHLAVIYAEQKDSSNCYRYLIQAINQGWLFYTLTLNHPSFQFIHEEKGFVQLLNEMKEQQAFAALEKKVL
ncbi:winged helix-turn-helix domain-containing protein [uncultured Shewanella sp.]|uniref:winged helix-turn-helix domain-containing protein n=1 Tax=uncultured Shewanella sp. TaxID=173975 RepID=UPI00263693C7|nr:winged helix-turn-helix domain-containing protein [uncultured Shewanella sp.]